jgi:hypothetical protein
MGDFSSSFHCLCDHFVSSLDSGITELSANTLDILGEGRQVAEKWSKQYE